MSEVPTSQAEARREGERFYFTGKPCKRGHVTKRFATNGTCAECGTTQVRESYRANRESIQKRRNATHAANPQPYRERDRARYWADHAASTAANQHKRAARLGLESTLTGDDIQQIVAEQGGRCAHCLGEVRLTVDHKVPLSRRGPNVRANVQMLCLPCNSRKGDK